MTDVFDWSPYLRPGETLLWNRAPAPRFLTGLLEVDGMPLLFALPIVFWIVQSPEMLAQNGVTTLVGVLIFHVLIFLMASWRFARLKRRMRHDRYAVTNERAMRLRMNDGGVQVTWVELEPGSQKDLRASRLVLFAADKRPFYLFQHYWEYGSWVTPTQPDEGPRPFLQFLNLKDAPAASRAVRLAKDFQKEASA